MSLSYRKTRSGEWVVFGPKAEMWDTLYGKVMGSVDVARKDGSVKRERLARLGTPFMAGGVEMAYGYIDHAVSDRSQVRAASRMYGMDMAEYGSGFGRDERRAGAR